MQPARAPYCIANNPRTVQRSSTHCIATSSQRIGLRIVSRASQRITSHPVQCSAPRESTSPRAAHCIANNPRTENQPATYCPPHPLARRTVHTSHLYLCTRFTVLCAGFDWFVVLTFPKFNLYTLQIANFTCVRSSVGTELGNLAQGPGFETGRKFSDFFYFRHFSFIRKKNQNFDFRGKKKIQYN